MIELTWLWILENVMWLNYCWKIDKFLCGLNMLNCYWGFFISLSKFVLVNSTRITKNTSGTRWCWSLILCKRVQWRCLTQHVADYSASWAHNKQNSTGHLMCVLLATKYMQLIQSVAIHASDIFHGYAELL